MTVNDSSRDKSNLVLGWQMTPMQEPKYWVGDNPKTGGQLISDLVTISSDSIANHTAIIAQSGSGKSFFLGRLIEEILLRTKARCVILDPNADFRKIHETEDESLWENAKYDPRKRRGKLPHEASRDEFEKQWLPVRKVTRIKTGGRGGMSGNNYETLQLLWSSLSVEFLAEEIDPMFRSDLYHCHTFAQDLEVLFRAKAYITDDLPENLITETEKLYRQARNSEEDFRSALEEDFNVDKLLTRLVEGEASALLKEGSKLVDVAELFGFPVPGVLLKLPLDKHTLAEVVSGYKELVQSRIRYLIERIRKAPKYVSEVIGHFYFSKAREYQIAGILQTELQKRPSVLSKDNRLEVVDLPSLNNKATTLLAINTILSMEWDRVRKEWSKALEAPLSKDSRVPTFIVVDEAHNLIPAETRGKAEYALREQFRTIVAEGRKYGLFLILVSQRPDKLDPLVLSECENKAIMKLSSGSVLKITKQMLGLDDIQPKLLEKSLDFEAGRVLLIGRWSQDEPQLLYCAARRTVEGGRNLREDYWAAPLETGRQKSNSKASKAKSVTGSSNRSGKSIKAKGKTTSKKSKAK
jgi:DNA helicase HerA-like ATPase